MEDETLDILKEKINENDSIEEKIRLVIEFMKSTLSFGKTPRFKDFWDAKKFILTLFKEKMNPLSRNQFWKEYTDLTLEAKRLKEILDEQSSFAIEQIERAIDVLDEDLKQFEKNIGKIKEIDFPENAYTLRESYSEYRTTQKELGYLNTLASRLNALRKEVINTDMRIRFKNKILLKLSHIGDQVFPKRKELIKTQSDRFMTDVESFIQRYFISDNDTLSGPPLYELREEIKAFQEMAKNLTVNTQAFQDSRKKLSGCWDKLRELDKERKKEHSLKKETYQENFEKISCRLKALKEQSQSITLAQLQDEIHVILSEMKEIELSRESVKNLKDQLFSIKREKEDEAQISRKKMQEEEETRKKNREMEIAAALDNWRKELSDDTDMEKRAQEFELAIQDLNLDEDESVPFEFLKEEFSDKLAERRESILLHEEDITDNLLEKLEEALQNRLSEREAVKKSLEKLRKEVGGSGLDFEKAMECRSRIDEFKSRLQKLTQAVDNLKKKIDDITE